MYRYTFNCSLTEKDKETESFEAIICDESLYLAKDRIEKMLLKEWGHITMRAYHDEIMRSEKFWQLILVNVEFLNNFDNEPENETR